MAPTHSSPVTTAPLGETIECSTRELRVQSAVLGSVPAAGSVIVVGDLLAVVLDAETGPTDPSRRTVALSLDGSNVNEAHPELALLLRSTFTARPILQRSGGLPTALPPLHANVRAADEDELSVLRTGFPHLQRLIDQPAELLASHLLLLCTDLASRVAAGQVLLRELSEDPVKLRIALSLLAAHSVR